MKLLILLSFINLAPQEDLFPLIDKGLGYLYREDYEKAESLFSLICNKAPSMPLGYLFKAVLLDRYMIDFSTDRYEKEYFNLLDTTIYLCNNKLLKERDKKVKALFYFYKGSALSYKATRWARKGSLVKALKDAKNAVAQLSLALKMDSTLFDAYLGLGVYDYAMGFLDKYFDWLPFVNNHKEMGIKRVKRAMEKGRFTKTLAKETLIWMYLYNDKPLKALGLAKGLCREYPDTRFSLWTLATCDTSIHRWWDALKTYKSLIPLIEKKQPDCYYCLSLLYYHIAQCYKELGKKGEAYTALERSSEILKREEKREKRAKNLRKKIEKLREVIKGVDNY